DRSGRVAPRTVAPARSHGSLQLLQLRAAGEQPPHSRDLGALRGLRARTPARRARALREDRTARRRRSAAEHASGPDRLREPPGVRAQGAQPRGRFRGARNRNQAAFSGAGPANGRVPRPLPLGGQRVGSRRRSIRMDARHRAYSPAPAQGARHAEVRIMTESPMKLGKNRTGCGLMGERKMQAPPVAEADLDLGTLAAGNLTQKFQQQAPAIGSIPPPDTAKGMLGAAVQAIKGNKLHVYVDKLGERLAFERGGVRLYDALLSKYDSARTNGEHLPPRDAIEAIREEELEHFRMLHDTIKDLGADPAAVTPSADLVGVQALGLMQVV